MPAKIALPTNAKITALVCSGRSRPKLVRARPKLAGHQASCRATNGADQHADHAPDHRRPEEQLDDPVVVGRFIRSRERQLGRHDAAGSYTGHLRLLESSMSAALFGALLAGLAGSPHCVLMCGPFAAACSRAGGGAGVLAWHLGRITSYAGLGALAGWLGAALPGPSWLGVALGDAAAGLVCRRTCGSGARASRGGSAVSRPWAGCSGPAIRSDGSGSGWSTA